MILNTWLPAVRFLRFLVVFVGLVVGFPNCDQLKVLHTFSSGSEDSPVFTGWSTLPFPLWHNATTTGCSRKNATNSPTRLPSVKAVVVEIWNPRLVVSSCGWWT